MEEREGEGVEIGRIVLGKMRRKQRVWREKTEREREEGEEE